MYTHDLHIDVESILRQKLNYPPKGDFSLPWYMRLVVRFLRRIIHEEEMNRFLALHSDLRNFDFIEAVVFEHLQCTMDVKGREYLENPRPCVFVSNHPLGGLDGMMEALMIHWERGERPNLNPRIIVNDLLLQMRPIAELFVPVNKIGADPNAPQGGHAVQSRHAAALQQQLWDSDSDILTFPAGACSRRQWDKDTKKWVVRDLPWHPSFIRRAIASHRDIIPLRFEGLNSDRFYRLAYWRKRLGIRANIEMLFLVDEMYRNRGKHFTIHILRPVSWQDLQSHSPSEWAQIFQLRTSN